MGLILAQMGRSNDSLAAFEQARVITQMLTVAAPSVAQYQHDLAQCYMGRGWILGLMGRDSEALTAWEKGRDLQQKLVDSSPNVINSQRELAVSYNNIAMLYSKMRKPVEALAAAERGRSIRQILAEANPRVPEYQRDLAISLKMIGALMHGERQTARAVDAYRRCIVILEQIKVLPAIDCFNLAETHAGLAALAPDPDSGLSAADRRLEAEQAIIWLRKSFDGGFRPSFAMMNAETELHSLRSRRDFQVLMMDLAMPEKPFAQ